MKEWKQDKLIDLLDSLIDYRGKTPRKVDKGIPLITAKIVKNGRIDTPTEFIDIKDYNSWMVRGFPKNGDVILTTEAPLGEVAQLDDKKIALAQRIVCLRGKEGVLDNTFLKYFLLSSLGQARLKARETGTTVTGIKQSELKEVLIDYPPYKYQKQITSILKSLDDKIELNRRINENLEQQAQALFKSWFVDFGPFKDGKFVDSELGMIPEGWKVVNLLNIAELYDSFRRPLSSRDRAPMEKLYPYYGATSVMDYVDNYIFDGIYLLMGEDGSVINEKGYPYLQYVFGKFWPNNHAHVMQGKNGFTTEMLHCFLLKKNISGIVTGAVQAKISQQSMKKILLAIPNENLCGEFACLIVPIYANIRNIINENRILSQLRDTLLPRLMSGELEIKDNSYD